MSKRRGGSRNTKLNEPEAIALERPPLLRKLDALWLIASITILLTAHDLWNPGTSVSDAEIVGLAITLGTVTVLSRHLLKYRRSKRAK